MICKISTLILQFISIPIVIRFLSKETFATYGLLLSVNTYASLCQIGISLYLSKIISENLNNISKINTIVSTSYFILVSNLLICTIFVYYYINSLSSSFNDINLTVVFSVVILIIFFNLNNEYLLKLLNGLNNLYIHYIYSSASNILLSIIIVVASVYQNSSLLLLICHAIAGVFYFCCVALFIRKKSSINISFSAFDKKIAILLIKYSIIIVLCSVLPSIIREIFRYNIAKTGNTNNIADINLLIQLYMYSIGIVMMLNTSIWPIALNSFGKDHLAYLKYCKMMIGASFLASILISIILIVSGTELVQLIFGNDYHFERETMLYLSIYIIGEGINNCILLIAQINKINVKYFIPVLFQLLIVLVAFFFIKEKSLINSVKLLSLTTVLISMPIYIFTYFNENLHKKHT